MMKLLQNLTFVLTILLSSFSAWADLTFGAEFTFTNPTIVQAGQNARGIVNVPEAEMARDAFSERVLKICNGCIRVVESNSYGVEVHKMLYPDGWYFVIATDPSVVEVQTKPTTLDQVEHLQSRMQKDIFDAAKEVGIIPDKAIGGGHIHFDYNSAVDGDLLKLRNLMVDFVNHPELASGIWNHDFYNSPPLAAQPAEQKEEFLKLLADVDSGKIQTVNQFVSRLRKKVYSYQKSNWGPTDKYQAVNLNRVNDPHFAPADKTIEIRSIRPQKSAAEYLAIVSVLAARIQLNKKRVTPLAVDTNVFNGLAKDPWQRHFDYVAEAGVSPRDYYNQMRSSLPSQLDIAAIESRIPKFGHLCKQVFSH